MLSPVLYEEYKQLHDERAERLQREAQVHAWLRGQRAERKSLLVWLSEHLKRSAGTPKAGVAVPS